MAFRKFASRVAPCMARPLSYYGQMDRVNLHQVNTETEMNLAYILTRAAGSVARSIKGSVNQRVIGIDDSLAILLGVDSLYATKAETGSVCHLDMCDPIVLVRGRRTINSMRNIPTLLFFIFSWYEMGLTIF